MSKKTIEATNRFLRRSSDEYKAINVNYILQDTKNRNNFTIIASDLYKILYTGDLSQDKINFYKISVSTNVITRIEELDFDVEKNIYKELQNGKDIVYMSSETHYSIWKMINGWYPQCLRYKRGLQKYLRYCKNNKITKEKISQETGRRDVPDVIAYYTRILKQRDAR